MLEWTDERGYFTRSEAMSKVGLYTIVEVTSRVRDRLRIRLEDRIIVKLNDDILASKGLASIEEAKAFCEDHLPKYIDQLAREAGYILEGGSLPPDPDAALKEFAEEFMSVDQLIDAERERRVLGGGRQLKEGNHDF